MRVRLMTGRYADILETIGRTPMVRLNELAPPDVNGVVRIDLDSFARRR